MFAVRYPEHADLENTTRPYILYGTTGVCHDALCDLCLISVDLLKLFVYMYHEF